MLHLVGYFEYNETNGGDGEIMCQVNVYIERDGGEELVMENVDVLEHRGGDIFLRSLFGEEKILPLSIKLISLVNNKIVLEG